MPSDTPSDGDVPDSARDSGPNWYADTFVWAIFLAVLAADQVSKAIITSTLDRGESWPDDGFFRATYARNSGTAFGLFQEQGVLLTIISLIAVAGMLYFFRGAALRNWVLRLAIGLMLGGAIGNLVDRLRLGFVVDFIDVGSWPIFNLADSSIVVGITILATMTILFPDRIDPARANKEGPSDDLPTTTAVESPDKPENPN